MTILVYSKGWGAQIRYMREVLGDLKENNLVANKNKCQFMRKFVEYLGHIILRKRVPSWLQTQK